VKSSTKMIMLVALVCAAPFVSAWVAYYIIKPTGGKSYGELLETRAMPALAIPAGDVESWNGRWRLIQLVAGDCAKDCEDALYATRQARTMLGRDKDRVNRIVLAKQPPSTAIVAAHPDLKVIAVPSSLPPEWRADLERGLLLVDPLGNRVILWPKSPDVKKLNQDLARLLRASRIG
jgi:hypothetical protein